MMNSRVNKTIKFPEGTNSEGKNKGKPIQAKASCNCPDGPAPHDEGGCSRPEKQTLMIRTSTWGVRDEQPGIEARSNPEDRLCCLRAR